MFKAVGVWAEGLVGEIQRTVVPTVKELTSATSRTPLGTQWKQKPKLLCNVLSLCLADLDSNYRGKES